MINGAFLKGRVQGFLSVFIFSWIISMLLIACNMINARQDIIIVAHRGGTFDVPENTFTAFNYSLELGVDIVEIDLRTSKDEKLFVLHDKTLDRTTSGTGHASCLALEELKRLDAGSWFDTTYAREKIPSFQEVLQWSADKDIRLLLDLKESNKEFARRVAGDIINHGTKEGIILGVRSPEQARMFLSLLPAVERLAFMSSPDQIEDFSREGVEVMRLWLSWLEKDPSLADKVRKTGAKLMINGSLGGIEETRMVLNFQPDWILTDHPAQLIGSLQTLKSKR
jgi:glycerophosphoryl diester phosphodiesterase